MSFCFLGILETDLVIFHSGADFLFLFHLGKRKEDFVQRIPLEGLETKHILRVKYGLQSIRK